MSADLCKYLKYGMIRMIKALQVRVLNIVFVRKKMILCFDFKKPNLGI